MSITPEQYAFLVRGIDPQRVQRANGHSHLEAWDVRRHLIRAFGFDGWTVETKSLDLVREIEHPPTGQGSKPRWTVVYRAEVRLTIKVAGQVVAVFEDGAAGDSCNQPSLGDAHDMAMKTALSQGLKRCAVNLGDAFGLGLYNGGGTDPVVLRSLVAPAAAPAADTVAVDDAPVQPEPVPPTADADPVEEVDPLPIRDQALDPDATRDDLLALHAQAKAAGLLGAEVVDDTGDTVALGELIVRRGRELAALETVPESAPVNGARPAIGPAPPADTRQHRHMHALWRQLGVTERDARLALTTGIIGRQVATSRDLSAIEAEQIIGSLQAELDARTNGARTPRGRVGMDAISQAISVAATPAELATALEPVRTNPGAYNQGERRQIDRWHQLATTRVGTPVAETAGAR